MEHTEATAAHLPERYLLGELNAAEADAFEEHFFDCAACADDLRAGMQFMDGGRALVRERVQPAAPVVPLAERRPRRAQWLPTAAAAVMTLAFVGALLTRGGAVAPRFERLDTVPLTGQTRAGEAESVVTQPGSLIVDLPQELPYERYQLRLVDARGKTVQTIPLSRKETSDSVYVGVSGHTPGRYQVVIEAADSSGAFRQLETRGFTIRD